VKPWTRRTVLGGAAAGAAVLAGGLGWQACPARQAPRRVTTIRANGYGAELAAIVAAGIESWPSLTARLPGASVLLKPNLVEHHPDRPINTHPQLVLAVAQALLDRGAARVVVAEGPGHRRDSEALLEGSGLGPLLRSVGIPYVDLNYDEPRALALPGSQSGLQSLPVAASVLDADLVISMPKLKTHHWAGVSLSMKNLFGTTCGAELGWPRNQLHWVGIDAVTVDLWRGLAPAFAIVDGIVGMEGDGPIMGAPVQAGLLAMGDHLPAVDATCARLMGVVAERVPSLRLARACGGTIAASRIDVDGDAFQARDFALPPGKGWLR
jgi:uncharacterized protein (DUF362 family)